MSINKELYGHLPDGREVYSFTLKNQNGLTAKILNYGCIIAALTVPDRYGTYEDICLGSPDLEGYLGPQPYFGSIIGRCANRIKDASFQLNGRSYQLAANDNGNALHGGAAGFDKKLWQADCRDDILTLSYISFDGEEGYPGTLNISVEYTLTDDNSLFIRYLATTTEDTPCNLTNHSYFNLGGHDSGSAMKHTLCIHADEFAHVGSDSLPDGKLAPVQSTPLDFTKPTPIGLHINEKDEQLTRVGGYDHNFILETDGKKLISAAILRDPASGRSMEIFTDCPNLQLYSGNWLDGGTLGKDGCRYQKRSGILLAPQLYPNAPVHPEFPSVILKPCQVYDYKTVYHFAR